MEENSGTKKKLRAHKVVSVVPAPEPPEGRPDSKTMRHAVGAETAEQDVNEEPMRVIEGGARKRAPDVKDHIGRQLKAVYDDVLNQPVPSRFMDLLHELASKPKADNK